MKYASICDICGKQKKGNIIPKIIWISTEIKIKNPKKTKLRKARSHGSNDRKRHFIFN